MCKMLKTLTRSFFETAHSFLFSDHPASPLSLSLRSQTPHISVLLCLNCRRPLAERWSPQLLFTADELKCAVLLQDVDHYSVMRECWRRWKVQDTLSVDRAHTPCNHAQLPPNHSSMTAGGRSSRMDTAQPTTGRAGRPLCDLAGCIKKSITTWSWLNALRSKRFQATISRNTDGGS